MNQNLGKYYYCEHWILYSIFNVHQIIYAAERHWKPLYEFNFVRDFGKTINSYGDISNWRMKRKRLSLLLLYLTWNIRNIWFILSSYWIVRWKGENVAKCVLVNPFLLVNRTNSFVLLFYLDILLLLFHQTQSNHSFIWCSHESFSSALMNSNVLTKGNTFITIFYLIKVKATL